MTDCRNHVYINSVYVTLNIKQGTKQFYVSEMFCHEQTEPAIHMGIIHWDKIFSLVNPRVKNVTLSERLRYTGFSCITCEPKMSEIVILVLLPHTSTCLLVCPHARRRETRSKPSGLEVADPG